MVKQRSLVTSIDTIAVVVSNRRRALEWYRDVLGLEEAFVPRDSAFPGGVGHWIEIGPGRPLTRLHICEVSKKWGIPGLTGITFLTSDIKRAYRTLKRRGVQFKSKPTKMEWGEWLCAFVDPDGNEFDLKQPVEPEK